MNGNACSHDWIRLHVEKAKESWEHVNSNCRVFVFTFYGNSGGWWKLWFWFKHRTVRATKIHLLHNFPLSWSHCSFIPLLIHLHQIKIKLKSISMLLKKLRLLWFLSACTTVGACQHQVAAGVFWKNSLFTCWCCCQEIHFLILQTVSVFNFCSIDTPVSAALSHHLSSPTVSWHTFWKGWSKEKTVSLSSAAASQETKRLTI